MAVLRGLHWAQHYCMTLTVLSVLWFVVRRGEADWPLAGMTAFAPTLMRAGCGYDRRGAGEELSARFLQLTRNLPKATRVCLSAPLSCSNAPL